jgi:hypothetical protein
MFLRLADVHEPPVRVHVDEARYVCRRCRLFSMLSVGIHTSVSGRPLCLRMRAIACDRSVYEIRRPRGQARFCYQIHTNAAWNEQSPRAILVEP